MNRAKFQELAKLRIEEANALLKASLWDGAYYLAGYAVECALKACIAKLTKKWDYPPNKKTVEDCYTHDLRKLVNAAKLEPKRAKAAKADPGLADNWAVVCNWTEAARYERKTEAEARELYAALTDPTSGVLTWVMKHW